MEVTFPGLGLEFNINREAFSIGSLSVYWYGIIIASGLVLACIYAFVRADYFKIDKNKLLNTVIVINDEETYCIASRTDHGRRPVCRLRQG